MLRSVTLKNFIRLSEECHLKFHKGGPYFLIGENGSGKSSLLEAVRRCMSYRSNTALSSIGNTKEDSYVICEYGLSETPSHEAYACLVHLKSPVVLEPGQEKKEKHYKLAYLIDPKGNRLGVDVVVFRGSRDPSSKHHALLNESIDKHFTKEEKQKLIAAFENPAVQGEPDVTSIIQVLRNHDQNIKVPKTTNFGTECEKILEKTDRSVAFIFENRGVGPMQWSQTRTQAHHWRSQERVQIIKRFLFEDELDEEEKKEEKEIFSTLTDNAKLMFYKDERDGNVRIKEHGMDYDLLKAPEGLLEAKQCSLLLAMKKYTTLCLEEPERGMHPQMIQRLRDLFLFHPKLRKKKTILITSHHPTLCAPWTVPKTFIFRRRQSCDKIVQKIIPGQKLVGGKGQGKKGEEEIDYKTPRLITSGPLPKLFFSRRVLFVEGENDFIFVTALMYQILKEGEEMQRVIGKLATMQEHEHQQSSSAASMTDTKTLLKELKQFVSSADLIQMQGETMKARLTQMCKILELDHYFLLDRNAVLEEEKSEEAKEPSSTKGTTQLIYKLRDLNVSFGLESKYKKGTVVNSTNWADIRSELYNKGVFIWRDGDLEDMVIRLCDKKRRTFERLEKESKRDSQERREDSEDEGPSPAKKPKQDSSEDSAEAILKKMTDMKLTILPHLYQKVKKKARKKLFCNSQLSDKNIKKSMKLILQECKSENDDLVQFIEFLLQCARSKLPRPEVKPSD